jgi:excinuclease ABC subunit A
MTPKAKQKLAVNEDVIEDHIVVRGAREHNLCDIDLVLPRNKLIVFTGVSGSGKSSLAFDTLYAEGSRRFLETLSAYARQFIGGLKRPDVDGITGLSPVISIEQKTVTRNPRSTVGTVTEVHDFLRLLYARAADAYSLETGEPMVRYTDEQITESIESRFGNTRLMLLAPLVRGRKGHYRELFDQVRRQGYVRARVDGEIVELDSGFKVDRYKVHDIELVIDRVVVGGMTADCLNR